MHMMSAMDDDRLSNLLGALALALTDAQGAAMEEASGLSQSAAAAVMMLGTNDGITIDALSRILGLSHSATVRAIERLHADGLVARIDREDRREVGLSLTLAGARLRRNLTAARLRVLGQAFARFGTDDREVLEILVSRLLDQVTGGRAQGDHICRLCDEVVCTRGVCPVEQKALRQES
jgi:MarR family transcriptional regulator, negative regulator of the multidrug operon emrRAB